MDTLSCIHGHTFLHSWTHFLAFMEWADDIGSRPAAWSCVPVQSSSCSLRVFYGTLVVGKDTSYIPLNKKYKRRRLLHCPWSVRSKCHHLWRQSVPPPCMEAVADKLMGRQWTFPLPR